jgi:transposase InsO family protein
LAKGETIKSLCRELGHSRASQYRWKDKQAGKKRGRPTPQGEVAQAMAWEVRGFDRAKEGTWGAHPIFEALGGIIPRSLVNTVLDERRDAEGRVKRPHLRTYEFVAPGVTFSADFISVRPRGRVLRVQDERARFMLGFAHRDHWPDQEVAAFAEQILLKFGPPYFFKHDLGGEFRGADFQAMLRRHRVIAVPNPPYYPKFNGKNERSNGLAREWIAPTEQDRPTLQQIWEKLTQQTLDQNDERRKDVLGGRTPSDVFHNDPRVKVDRDALYSEWDALREETLHRVFPNPRRLEAAQLESMRLAALVVVKKHELVRYPSKPEAPKVSG